jgi:hypothetical protein
MVFGVLYLVNWGPEEYVALAMVNVKKWSKILPFTITLTNKGKT